MSWPPPLGLLSSAILEPTLIDGKPCLPWRHSPKVSQGQAAVFPEHPAQNICFLQGPWLPASCVWTCCHCGLQGDLAMAEQTAEGPGPGLWVWLPVYPMGSTDITPRTDHFHSSPLSPSVSAEPHKWAHPPVSDRHHQNHETNSTWWWKIQGK